MMTRPLTLCFMCCRMTSFVLPTFSPQVVHRHCAFGSYDDIYTEDTNCVICLTLGLDGHANRSSSNSQGAAKSHQSTSKAGQVSVSPPAGKQNASPSMSHGSQAKAIPSYMDDFKYGFPSSGLSCETMKWWGRSSDTDCELTKDGSREAHGEASKGMTDDDELDWGADEAEADGAVTAEASAQLCSLRRKAVDDGRKLLNGDTRRAQEFSRLNKRQKLALAQVFGASLPDVVLLVFSE